MNVSNEVLMITGMMIVTFSIRYVLLAFSGRFSLPVSVEKALNYVPPAVLTAIIVPSVLLKNSEWNLSWENPYLPSALAATLAGFLFPRRVLAASISSGLVVFLIVTYFQHIR